MFSDINCESPVNFNCLHLLICFMKSCLQTRETENEDAENTSVPIGRREKAQIGNVRKVLYR